MSLAFYEAFYSCYVPAGLLPIASFAMNAPGSSATGVQACRVVTVDLAGTSHTFTMGADADGVFDGTHLLDTFGWSYSHGATHSEPGCVQLFIDAGAALDAVDTRGSTALGIARMDTAELLIAAGASLAIGHPLHWAVRCSQTGTVKLLLEAGADPSALDGDGKRAADYTSPDVILDLLSAHSR